MTLTQRMFEAQSTTDSQAVNFGARCMYHESEIALFARFISSNTSCFNSRKADGGRWLDLILKIPRDGKNRAR
jgi:hypothetical protein